MPDYAIAAHLSFNLRLARNAGTDTWRITLYDAQTGSTLHLTSLAQLTAFLRIVMRGEVSEVDQAAEGEPAPLILHFGKEIVQ